MIIAKLGNLRFLPSSVIYRMKAEDYPSTSVHIAGRRHDAIINPKFPNLKFVYISDSISKIKEREEISKLYPNLKFYGDFYA